MFDGEAFGAEVVEQVRGYVERATAALRAEVAALEAKLADRPQPVTSEQVAEMVRAAVSALPPPKDGESVDPEAVKAMVDEAVAALPRPQDGKDFTAEDAAPLIAEEVGKAVAALPPAEPGKDADPDVIRQMVDEAVAALPRPQDGKDFTAEDAAPLIAEEVGKAVAALPPAEPGKDADPDVIRQMVDEAVAALPPAEPGKDAEPATEEQIDAAVQRHIDANPIKAVTVEDLAPVLASQVAEAVSGIPPAKDGKDAAQIASFVKDHTGSLVVTLTDGRVIETGIRDGAKGDPGRDGLDLTGFDTELSEDGRILTLSLENDEIKVTHELQLATMIYRGVFRSDAEYVQGDVVTFGGSLWHCNAATTDKPDSGSEAWTLAAKRGRDGKDAKP